MTNKRKYYKVVRISNKKYRSFNPCLTGVFNLEYKIGEWTKPKLEDSMLFCFSSKKAAQNFLYNCCLDYSIYKIFECEIESAYKICPLKYIFAIDIKSLKLKWKNKNLYKKSYLNPVYGSVATKAIKLIKEV